MSAAPGRTRLARIETAAGPIAYRESAGAPDGAPTVLMLHGWAQSSLSFRRQLTGPLAARARLVAPDLPGHGASPAPADPADAGRSDWWAGVVAALVEALAPDRPVLLGWSMGGWLIGDFLRAGGADRLGGIVTTGSVARIGAAACPAMIAKRRADVRAEGFWHDDPQVRIEAAIAFLRALTAGPMSKQDLAFHTAQMMACPPALARAARGRDDDWRADFARARYAGVPARVIQGGAERVCFAPQAAETAEALGAGTVVIAGAGHMPFWEVPQDFDAAVLGILEERG